MSPTSSKIGGGCAARQACPPDEQKIRMVRDTLLSKNFQNASSPPSEKRKGSPGTGDKLGKVLFGQSQKGKSGRNLIMVLQNFNFISESGDPRYIVALMRHANATEHACM